MKHLPNYAKMNSIAAQFDAQLRPLFQQYIESPPSDPKQRKDAYRKLSERVMQQVILKLDEVETAGEEGARSFRRQLIRDVQGALRKMAHSLSRTSFNAVTYVRNRPPLSEHEVPFRPPNFPRKHA